MNRVKGYIMLATLSVGMTTPIVSGINAYAASTHATTKTNKPTTKQAFITAANKLEKKTKTQEHQAATKARDKMLLAQGVNPKKLDTTQKDATEMRVIVQLDGAAAEKQTGMPTGSKKSIKQIDEASDAVIAKQAPVKKQIKGKFKDAKVGRSYGYLVNGFSMTVKFKDIKKIKKLSGVKNVTIAKKYQPADADANAIAGVEDAWQGTAGVGKYKGEGLVVSVIDTGIDATHKDLRLSDESTAALTASKVKDTIGQIGHGRYLNAKVPYAFNYADKTDAVQELKDTEGEAHGMHVAGIIGANGENPDGLNSVVGVAPEAQLLDMKVFSNHGGSGAWSDDIVAAIEDSVALGADVLNLSLGSSSAWDTPLDAQIIALNKAAEKGVLPVVAAGNAGTSSSTWLGNAQSGFNTVDDGTVGTPGVAKEALTVASAENSKITTKTVEMFRQSADGKRTPLFDKGVPAALDETALELFSEQFKDQGLYDRWHTSGLNIAALPDVVGGKHLSQADLSVIDSDPDVDKDEVLNNPGDVLESNPYFDDSTTSDTQPKTIDRSSEAALAMDPVAPGLPGRGFIADYAKSSHQSQETFKNSYGAEQDQFNYGTNNRSDVKNKIVLATYNNIFGVAAMAQLAVENGAFGLIVVNPDEKDGVPTLYELGKCKIPVMMVSATAGKVLKKLADETYYPGWDDISDEGKAERSKYDRVVIGKVDTAKSDNSKNGTLSSFTSWGPTPNLELKPEIAAPGGNIWSTNNDNRYQLMSGTSMATPFVAGSEALIMQHLKATAYKGQQGDLNFARDAKLSAINTSVPYFDQDHQDSIVSPRRQGAGEIRVDKAIQNNTILRDDADEDGVLSLKEIGRKKEFTVTLHNTGNKAVSYDVDNYGGVYTQIREESTTQALPISFYDSKNYVEKAGDTPTHLDNLFDQKIPGAKLTSADADVDLQPGETKKITFTISLPGDFDKNQFVEGYVGFKGTTKNTPDLVAPYMGLYGDYSSDNIVDKPAYEKDSIYGMGYFLDGNGANYDAIGTAYSDKTYYDGDGFKYLEKVMPDAAAFSPNGDSVRDSVIPRFQFKRSAKDVAVDIVDAKGKVVKNLQKLNGVTKGQEYTNTDLAWNGKTHNAVTDQDEVVPDGQYEYRLTADDYLNPDKKQVTEYPITVDTTGPVVKNVKFEANDGHYYVSGTATDEFGLSENDNLIVAVNGQHFAIATDHKALAANNKKYQFKVEINADAAKYFVHGDNNIQIGVYDEAQNVGYAAITTNLGDNDKHGRLDNQLAFSNFSRNEYDPDGWILINLNQKNYDAAKQTLELKGTNGGDFKIGDQIVEVNHAGEFDVEISLAKQPKNLPVTDLAGTPLAGVALNFEYTLTNFALAANQAANPDADITMDNDGSHWLAVHNYNQDSMKVVANAMPNAKYVKIYNTGVQWVLNADEPDKLEDDVDYAEPIKVDKAGTVTREVVVPSGLSQIQTTSYIIDDDNQYSGPHAWATVDGEYHHWYTPRSSNSMVISRDAETPTRDALETFLNFDNRLGWYGSLNGTFNNTDLATYPVYDRKTGEAVITGRVRDDVKKLWIADPSGDVTKQQEVKVDSETGAFEYRFKTAATSNSLLNFRFQTDDGVIYTSQLRYLIDFDAPIFSFDDNKWQTDKAGNYEVWTNDQKFDITGYVGDKDAGCKVAVNGDVIYSEEGIGDDQLNAGAYYGRDIEKSKFTKAYELAANATSHFKVTITDAHGNTVERQITVHHNNVKPAVPVVKADAPKGGQHAKVTASAAKDVAVYFNEHSASAKDWTKYTGQVTLNDNHTIYFKSVDKYGNESTVVSYKVTSIVPAAKPVVKPTKQPAKATAKPAKPTASAKHKHKGYIYNAPFKVKLKVAANTYSDVNLKKHKHHQKAHTVLKIKAVKWTKHGTPRLETTHGQYITANKHVVAVVK